MGRRTYWVFTCSPRLDEPEPHEVLSVQSGEEPAPYHHLTKAAAEAAREAHVVAGCPNAERRAAFQREGRAGLERQ